MTTPRRRAVLLAALVTLALGRAVRAGSDVPPPGPKWTEDLLVAQEEALKAGKPIFCYFTKTYCPHCVKVEKELLTSPRLAAAYDKVVWLYDYQDFTKDARDRRAERIAIRFGVTSWPQLFLVDPVTMEILKHTGREVDGFLEAVATTQVSRGATTDAAARLAAAEKEAVLLEEKPSVKAAREAIGKDDVVVRTRALEILAKEDPKGVAARAVDLLAVKNDPFRFRVCEVLKEAADAEAAEALEGLVRQPRDSLNPNVLRIRAVEALATCGRPESLDAIAPHATSGEYFNGLTGTSIDAMLAIAKRFPKTEASVRKTLRAGYPVPPEDRTDRAYTAAVALAKRIFAAVGEKGSFPDPYDAKARERLMP